ncbi:MAG: ATP-binding cassette domain-containing protein [Verrucomicrobiales bacterium]|nr:ATP-binding cassette domain-containing protein [Verrucomicrobiales bacterium]
MPASTPPEPSTTPRQSTPQPTYGHRRQSLWRRIGRRLTRRKVSRTEESMLPVLIQVFAGFSKMDGRVDEADIDSTLGFLRYDYPETVYSELRELYAQALHEWQNLDEIAEHIAERLHFEDKILLGVQLYVLISRADLQKEHLISFYQFMTTLGVASEAIALVYQLNTSDPYAQIPDDTDDSTQPLETLIIGRRKPADVVLPTMSEQCSLAAFRFQELILLKNIGSEPVIVRGRYIRQGEFCRIYEGQAILLAEVVLDYHDIVFYLNAKKNVSSTQLFLSLDHNNKSHFIEKSRSKLSYLEIKFGLDITVKVLRDMEASINAVRLNEGIAMEVNLNDKIFFDDLTEIAISDLRRRARELGGRFDLLPNRTEYLVSNNPNMLREGDILLSSGSIGELLLRIRCDYAAKSGELEILAADRPIMVGDLPVRGSAYLKDGDTIAIGEGQYLRCHFSDGIIEEEHNIISSLQVRDLSHSYDKRTTALDNISFAVQRGEMICVMGPSGCGKSTLLKTLAGQLDPHSGKILLNSVDLYDHRADLTYYISYIPHEEALDPLLTVEENLDTAAAIRAPYFTRAERRRRADAKIVELGLSEMRHRLAGDASTKHLSGGQRKRLNAGLDMIGISDVYLFDEPTSGLSSKDSEHVLEIIRGLTHNKITFVSIHQPSSRLFQLFDKALLLDNGGKLAFFGTPAQMLTYFAEARDQEGVAPNAFAEPDTSMASLHSMESMPHDPNSTQHNARQIPLTPDFIFDILETPLRDLSGDVIYEPNDRGQLAPARRFNPDFWRDRFQTYRLLEEVHQRQIEPDASAASHALTPPRRPKRNFSEEWVHLANQFKRAFLSKLRNKANLATTLLEAPMLAVLVATVLRYSEEGHYNFASAFHIPTYLFLTLVIALFLGLTNSSEEVIRDRILLERERNHGIRVSTYILSKIAALGFFALLQCVIYLLIGNAILGIRDMFWHNLFWMFSTSFVGITMGLFISSMVKTSKTAINIIPLILIPNIILGGALIKYEEMNSGLDVFHSISTWLGPEQSTPKVEPSSNLQVPAVCNIMPLRWSYEALIIGHAERNPASALINDIQSKLDAFMAKKELSDEEEVQLDQAKEALAIVYGLSAPTAKGVHNKLKHIRRALENNTLDPDDYISDNDSENSQTLVTAEDIYLNGKVLDLFNRAEVEKLDYRQDAPPNVFFGSNKRLTFPVNGGEKTYTFDTLKLNALAMAAFALLGLICLQISLTRQLRKV